MSFNSKCQVAHSRGILTHKPSWYVISEAEKQVIGVGECSLIEGLSPDDLKHVEQVLLNAIHHDSNISAEFPAARFGMEMWELSKAGTEPYNLYQSDFLRGEVGIPINGLIWMGSSDYMKQQVKEKLSDGYTCIKMKIGAIDFDEEYRVIHHIRREYNASDITIRVDANGGFTSSEALEKLKRLSELDIHSIEQPIQAKQYEEMANLCIESPIPIALDEELIGVYTYSQQEQLLRDIQPAYIILKPSLVGGIQASQQWIGIAEKYSIGWWITSALESNIGLNAIAQWTATLGVGMPQGLGTGGLFTNNIESPLVIREGHLWYDRSAKWDSSMIGG